MYQICLQVQFSPLGLSSCLKNLDGSYFGQTDMLFEGTFQPAFEIIIHAAQLSLTAQKYLQKHHLALIFLLCDGPIISITLPLNI